MIPAAVLRPPQMLDSRTVGSQAAGSRSSMFFEHMSEMEDTVSSSYLEPFHEMLTCSSVHGQEHGIDNVSLFIQS